MTIEFLKTPTEFYAHFLNAIRTATLRISIATLYMDDPVLVEELEKRAQLGVVVDVLMDGNRATRRGSCHMPPGLRVHLSKQCTFGPPRLREMFGTQHVKFAVFDDTVIVTGANLSSTYFTNRQDRYVVFSNAPDLADWLASSVGVNTCFASSVGAVAIQRNREDCIVKMALEKASRTEPIFLASPYLNLSPDILELLNGFRDVSIITGTKSSNAFYNSKGLSKHVPDLYEVLKRDLPRHMKLFEYSRPGWSFHAKGIWTEKMTVIGSSNFGARSRFRDTELTMLLNTVSPDMIRKDLDNTLQWCNRVDSVAPVARWIQFCARGPLRSLL